MAGLCTPLPTLRPALTSDGARLGADVDCYSFIVSDLHRLLPAGLPAHCETFCTSTLRENEDWLHELSIDMPEDGVYTSADETLTAFTD